MYTWNDEHKQNLYASLMSNFFGWLSKTFGVELATLVQLGDMLEILIKLNPQTSTPDLFEFDVVLHSFSPNFDLLASGYRYPLPFVGPHDFH